MKKVLQILAVLVLLPVLTFAQSTEWEFQTVVPSDTAISSSHGVAFDAAGNIWNGPYYSVVDEGGNSINPVYCYTPEGEACDDVDRVYGVETGDSTLYFGPITGLTSDHNGNIIVSSHGYRAAEGRGWDGSRAFLIRIDPNTGESLGVGEVTVMRTETASHAFHIAADNFGYIFYSAVFPGEPIRVVDEDFDPVLNVIDNRPGFGRSIGVSSDGSKVYSPTNYGTEFIDNGDTTIVGGRLAVYEGDVFGTYEPLDTMSFIGMDPGAVAVCPQTDIVYAPASGSGNNPEGDPDRWDALTVYGLYVKGEGDYNIVDTFTWDQGDGDLFNPIYRAMGISDDGLSIGVGGFATSGAGVQLFTREALPDTEEDEHPDVPSNWDFASYVPSDTSIANTHGLAFDGEDKLWNGNYYQTFDEDDNPARALECIQSDLETPCDFSPVYRIEHEDTTFRFGMMTGVAADENGDILVSMHGHIYNAGTDEDPDFAMNTGRAFIARIDHQTGEGLDVVEITSMRTDDVSHAFHLAVDGSGYIYYSAVFPGEPIHILDPDLGVVGEVTDNRAGFARTIAVNAEGTKVYQPTDNSYIEVYEGDAGPFGTYELVDTTTTAGIDPGAVAVHPTTGVLYASASGTGWGPLTDEDKWDPMAIYGFDPAAGYEVVDQLKWHFGDADEAFHPYRGMAIKSDGSALVAGSFGGQGLQRFTAKDVSVEDFVTYDEIPEGVELEQNYPNPFNPATTIRYTIPENMDVRLDVYNVAGQRVATLVNEMQSAGSHTVSFDASQLASGVYIYRITAGNYVESRKMMFIK